MIQNRRAFLTGLGLVAVTAPAIVRASSLMPVRSFAPDFEYEIIARYLVKGGGCVYIARGTGGIDLSDFAFSSSYPLSGKMTCT